MTQTFVSGYTSTLALQLNPADTTMTVATVPGVTSGRLYFSSGSQREWIDFTGVSGNTLTGLVRGLSATADPATAGTGLLWIAGQKFALVAMHDQLIDKQQPTASLQVATIYATIADRNTALGGDGVAAYPYLGIKVTETGLTYLYNTTTAEWEPYSTGTVTPNATPTSSGSGQVGNSSDFFNSVDVGISGAYEFPTNSIVQTIIHGATLKASPTGADEMLIADSAASFAQRKTTLTDLVTNIPITSLANNAFMAGQSITAGNALFLENNGDGTALTALDIGNASATTRQSCLEYGTGVSMTTSTAYLKKTLSPTVSLLVRVETDSAGSPSGVLINANATASVTAGSLTTSFASHTITFSGAFTIPLGTPVHYVFSQTGDNVDATNYYSVAYSVNQTTTRFEKTYNGATWGSTTNKFVILSGTGIQSNMLALADTTYIYKSSLYGFSNQTVSAGSNPYVSLPWSVNTFQSGLSTGELYYLQDTPGTIGLTPGTNTSLAGVATSATSIYAYFGGLANAINWNITTLGSGGSYFGGTYFAAQNGFIRMRAEASAGGATSIDVVVKSDTASTPTTVVATAHTGGANTEAVSVCPFIAAGNYFTITITNGGGSTLSGTSQFVSLI